MFLVSCSPVLHFSSPLPPPITIPIDVQSCLPPCRANMWAVRDDRPNAERCACVIQISTWVVYVARQEGNDAKRPGSEVNFSRRRSSAERLNNLCRSLASFDRKTHVPDRPTAAQSRAADESVDRSCMRATHAAVGAGTVACASPVRVCIYTQQRTGRRPLFLWTHAQRCVHVIFCRCFFYIFYARLSWPNG